MGAGAPNTCSTLSKRLRQGKTLLVSALVFVPSCTSGDLHVKKNCRHDLLSVTGAINYVDTYAGSNSYMSREYGRTQILNAEYGAD